MAEYIDRNLIEWYGCNFEDTSCKNRECSVVVMQSVHIHK